MLGCGGGSGSSEGGGTIQTRLSTPATLSPGPQPLAFSGGAASATGLQSLKYYIRSITVCESMEITGSGFSNPSGCLELYHGDESMLSYESNDDWTPLADAARHTDTGFVDLVSDASRSTLSNTTPITHDHVRSYNYGVITWSLPIKVKAQIALQDGTTVYTHDGTTTFETIGADHFRDYFTTPALALNSGPAEEAVVLLPNGGNWFRFQNPLVISDADVDERRNWVLDLVFNPDGIVKGFAGDGISGGSLRERNGSGQSIRAIAVPMLDLLPVPHRATDSVLRESYVAHVDLGTNAFDARIELYSVEGDANGTIYGVDAKSLVSAGTVSAPPDMSKISYLSRDDATGTLSFLSWNKTPIITGFTRGAHEADATTASIVCATHDNRAGAEGGAAIVVEACPAAAVNVTFTLVSRGRLTGSIPIAVGAGPADGGAE